jgi:hypothetical protein
MSVDCAWMSQGGFLLDGTGDIAFTANPLECLQDMAYTRLKAAFNGWKLYPGLGADLEACVGRTVAPEIQTTIERKAQAALSNDFLPAGSFQIKTIAAGNSIQVFVFLQKTLIASYTVTV